MVKLIFDSHFKKNFKKIKYHLLKKKIIKQISKLKDNPEIGKPMKYTRKRTRELYIKPYRLSYKIEDNVIYVLDLYHKDNQ